MSNLIVRAELAAPPSMASSFRDLTLHSSFDYKADCLVEVEPEFIDLYFHWMRARGLLDFVEQFIKPNEEFGVFIDRVARRSRTIVVDRIVPENLPTILRKTAAFLS